MSSRSGYTTHAYTTSRNAPLHNQDPTVSGMTGFLAESHPSMTRLSCRLPAQHLHINVLFAVFLESALKSSKSTSARPNANLITAFRTRQRASLHSTPSRLASVTLACFLPSQLSTLVPNTNRDPGHKHEVAAAICRSASGVMEYFLDSLFCF